MSADSRQATHYSCEKHWLFTKDSLVQVLSRKQSKPAFLCWKNVSRIDLLLTNNYLTNAVFHS